MVDGGYKLWQGRFWEIVYSIIVYSMVVVQYMYSNVIRDGVGDEHFFNTSNIFVYCCLCNNSP